MFKRSIFRFWLRFQTTDALEQVYSLIEQLPITKWDDVVLAGQGTFDIRRELTRRGVPGYFG